MDNIKIINGRPRHPQSQGLIERGNCEIGKLLGKWMETYRSNNWCTGLRFVLWAMNTTTCRATGQTPYQLVFGNKPKGNLGFLHALNWNNSILLEEDIPDDVSIEQNDENDVNILYLKHCLITLFTLSNNNKLTFTC